MAAGRADNKTRTRPAKTGTAQDNSSAATQACTRDERGRGIFMSGNTSLLKVGYWMVPVSFLIINYGE
jgi:hypothetical protein